MFSINTNVSALSALQSLSQTQTELTATENAVSTGLKVSSASDNPAVYAIGQAMNARLSGLSAVSDNLNFAQSVISTAQAAATEISSQLATLKNTVTQGQQSGIDATTIDNQITAILSNIDSIANSATFNGVNIVGGTGTDNITGAAISTSMNVTQDMQGTTLAVSQQDMTTGATGLGLTGLNASSNSVSIAFTNAFAPADGDHIKLTSSTGSTYDFILSDGTGTETTNTDPSATASTTFVNISATDSNTTVLTKIATAMQSKGFGATINSSGNLVITGNDLASATATVASGGATAGAATSDAIATVDSAIKALNTKIANLGSKSAQITGMQTFSSALSTALTEGLGALTDADMTSESAKLQSLQTKQSLGIQALSMANTQPQSLLTLFR
ncbi:flagellin [Telmatospirillum sp.]|uniref:flagellin n=1 Tax=Telmatospirillum sp. TaxID=2079197 RepID=UPI00284E4BEE|nr:flagellin [Telmatospirillum sp.]MDR3440137.1 flagellin [Telmatospirillum sp.]